MLGFILMSRLHSTKGSSQPWRGGKGPGIDPASSDPGVVPSVFISPGHVVRVVRLADR